MTIFNFARFNLNTNYTNVILSFLGSGFGGGIFHLLSSPCPHSSLNLAHNVYHNVNGSLFPQSTSQYKLDIDVLPT